MKDERAEREKKGGGSMGVKERGTGREEAPKGGT